MGERSPSIESGYFARNIATILTHGNINPNVDFNKISPNVLRRQGKLSPRNNVSERLLWFWVGIQFFQINAVNLE